MTDLEYGQIKEKVDRLEREVSEIRADIRSLLDLANHSKGAFWASMSMASALGAIISWFAQHFGR